MIYFDLKQEAQRKSIGDAVSREIELRRIARTLKRQFNNNVLVRGASGVGKSALVEAFSYRAALNKISGFENTAIIKLDPSNLKRFFSQSNNTEVASYLHTAFDNLPPDTIVVIDDFDIAIPEMQFQEVVQYFTPFFESANLRLLISASEQRYQKLLEENSSFFLSFEQIELKECDREQTLEVLKALSPAFEKQYNIKIPENILNKVVELSQKISSDKKSPLRAIHFLDEALAFAEITGSKDLQIIHAQEIYAEKTGVPSGSLTDKDADMLDTLEDQINSSVIGQPHAAHEIANIVKRGRMGLRNPHRPLGSFLLLGPSGVGKTEISKVLAKIVYGTERAFSRIDMSEFMEQHTVQRLIGAPPGYVGYEAGGQLTNAIKQQPYSLLLLDEIEKAHSKIFDIFLQVFDDGRLTDGQGQTVSFTDSIVIATSNLGINEIVEAYKKGEDPSKPEFLEKNLMPILMKNFRTEFLNRFDAIIVFKPLSLEDLIKIANLEIKKIEERTKEHNIKFNIDPEVLKKRITQLLDYRFGARPVKRFIEQTCESLIAHKLLKNRQK
jgi:ATP-dependent Clp protease ATP-binding subunit ClpC